MFTSACIGCVANDLARIVDSDGVRKSEARTGRNQHVEIDQPAGFVNERNMLAGFWWVVLCLAKVCRPHDLSGYIDSLCQV